MQDWIVNNDIKRPMDHSNECLGNHEWQFGVSVLTSDYHKNTTGQRRFLYGKWTSPQPEQLAFQLSDDDTIGCGLVAPRLCVNVWKWHKNGI
jgi:hypothetical protein